MTGADDRNAKYARRQADDRKLLDAYEEGPGWGKNMRALREFVHHVRSDIGAQGVIAEVGIKDDGTPWAGYYIEPEPDERPAVLTTPTSAASGVPAMPPSARPAASTPTAPATGSTGHAHPGA